MGRFQNAIDIIKREAERMKALTDLGDALDEFGSLENTLISLKEQVRQHSDMAAASCRAMEQAKADLAGLREQAASEAKDLVDRKAQHLEFLGAQKAATSNEIQSQIDRANNHIAERTKNADAQVLKAKQNLAAVESKIADREEYLKGVEARLADIKKAL